MEEIIIKIFSVFIESLFISYYFKLSCDNKNVKTNYGITLICSFVILGIANIINLKQYNTILNTLVLVIVLTGLLRLLFKTSLLHSVLTVVSYYVIMVITEIIGYFLLSVVLNADKTNLMNITYQFLVLVVIQHILATLFVLAAYSLFTKKYGLKALSFKHLKLLLLMILGYILPQIMLFTFNSYSYPLPLLMITCIQTILVSILIFYYFKSIINREKVETELVTTELHNKTLIGIVDGVRTLKHDYGNIIQALNGYVVTKQYERLHEYVDSLMKEFNTVNNISSIDPKIFNEPAIYGVVGAKYFYAIDHNISFEIDVTSDIKNINFSKPELSRILGILLDNAIEATQKVEDKYIRLEIHFNDKKFADVIKIYNTYDTSLDINLTEIYEKGVSSKKQKSGIGLWEVKKLVARNGHSQIFANIEKEKFVQNLIIEKAD